MSLVSKLSLTNSALCPQQQNTYAVALHVANMHAKNGEAPCRTVLCPSFQTSKLSVQLSNGARILSPYRSVFSKLQSCASSVPLSIDLVVLERRSEQYRRPFEAFSGYYVRMSEGQE